MAYGDERINQVAGYLFKRGAQANALLDPAKQEQEEQDADKVKSNAKAAVSPKTEDPKYNWDQPGLRSEVGESMDLYGGGRPAMPKPPTNTFTGPKDPRLAGVNKQLDELRGLGTTDDTGKYPGGAAASDAFQAGQDRQLQNSGAHVYATINGKQYDYTSKATNDNPYMASQGPQERAPRLGTYTDEQYYPDPNGPAQTRSVKAPDGYQMLPQRFGGQQDPFGGNIRPVKTVSDPGVSMIQGTREQQQEHEHEDLARENAIAEQKYQQQYLNMSPQERAQTEAQRKASADPRMMAVQQGLSIYQEGIQKSAAAVAAYRRQNPMASEADLKRVHDSVFQNYQGVLDYLQGLFNNKQQFPGEYTAPPQQMNAAPELQ